MSVDIVFPNARIAADFNDIRSLVRSYGPDNARRIRRRLDDLQAAAHLADMHAIFGGRLHALVGDRAGCFALDLKHPQRLIFEPANEPLPYKDDGGLDWPRITTVRILRVEDYHG